MIDKKAIDKFSQDVLETIDKLRAEIERLKKLADTAAEWKAKYEAYQDTPEAKENARQKAKADTERLSKELEVAKKRSEELTKE